MVWRHVQPVLNGVSNDSSVDWLSILVLMSKQIESESTVPLLDKTIECHHCILGTPSLPQDYLNAWEA